MRWRKIKSNLFAKSVFAGLMTSAIMGCQNQSVSDTVNTSNVKVSTSNTNGANQSNADTKIPAPQAVKFESADKVEIIGTFYESPKADAPAVLLLHQWMQNRQSYDALAKRLQAKNFGVLAIDGRGFGDSTKTTDGKEVKQNPAAEKLDANLVKNMTADVENAFQFLTKQKNVNASRVGIVGASYGSSLAIIYAAENPQVKAVALLSPGINYFDNLPTEPAVKKYGNRQLLLVAAEDDEDSVEAVKKLKATGGSEKYEIKVYEKGGHGTDLFGAKVGLEDLLEQFLTKNL